MGNRSVVGLGVVVDPQTKSWSSGVRLRGSSAKLRTRNKTAKTWIITGRRLLRQMNLDLE